MKMMISCLISSYGMTFVKIKNLDALEKFKSNIDWKKYLIFATN